LWDGKKLKGCPWNPCYGPEIGMPAKRDNTASVFWFLSERHFVFSKIG